LEDLRRISKGDHLLPLEEILSLFIATVFSGADTCTSICLFGHAKLEWSRKFYPFENGILSKDGLRKVFTVLDLNTEQQSIKESPGSGKQSPFLV